MNTRLRAFVELTRAPAALSVPGDVLAGAAAAGWPFRWRTPALAGASVAFYWAGMALNDYADREVDARERPTRPIPSGRVLPREALAVGAGLTAAGLAIAAAAGGRRALAVAIPLAASVWAYDFGAKGTPFGPAAMASARGFDVLLGAGGGRRLRAALPAAATMAAHTYVVTTLSSREVEGATPALPRGALAATSAITGSAAVAAVRAGTPVQAATSVALLGAYAQHNMRAQTAAMADPSPSRLQRAVGAGILSMVPLQASLAARAGAARSGVALAALFPLARRLSRRISAT